MTQKGFVISLVLIILCKECIAPPPTNAPTLTPTMTTELPSITPTKNPSINPTRDTMTPSKIPTQLPSITPTETSDSPTKLPTKTPTMRTNEPTRPTEIPTNMPTNSPVKEEDLQINSGDINPVNIFVVLSIIIGGTAAIVTIIGFVHARFIARNDLFQIMMVIIPFFYLYVCYIWVLIYIPPKKTTYIYQKRKI